MKYLFGKDLRFLYEKYVLGQHRHGFEKEVRKALKPIKGSIFVDVGANQGLYTRLLAKNFDKVYAVEPNPNVIPLLRSNLFSRYRLKNVVILTCALSNKVGTGKLYLDPFVGMPGSTETILPTYNYKPNLDPTRFPPHTYSGKEGVEVQTETYDHLQASIFQGRVDLVKIDVEGAEFLVLDGMTESIGNGLVSNIMVELHNQDDRAKLESMLSRASLSWLDENHLLASFTLG